MSSNIKKKNKNIRISEFSNQQLLNMDIIEIYKLLLEGRITRFPPGIWENPEAIENSLKCAKYLLEDILKWDLNDIKSKVRVSVFVKYKLSGMLKTLYRNSPYEILSLLYPNQIMPWELHEAPTKIWHEKENRLIAMDWLINKKLKWTKDDIIEHYNSQILIDNDLGGLLSEGGHGSAFTLLNEFMPNEFNPWDLKSSISPLNFWKDKGNRVSAIKNMIENTLKWDKEDIKKKLSQQTFKDNNLGGLLNSYYNASPYKALQEVYPNEFLPWELSCAPAGFWNIKENRVAACKWLFETKLNWTIEDIKTKINQKVFYDYGLSTLATKVKGGIYALTLEAYPEIKEWEFPYTNATYWENEENRRSALDYLFREKFNWSNEDIKKNASQKLFMNNNLSGLLNYYNGSPYQLVKEYLSDEDVKGWELPVISNGFWKDNKNCREAMEWLIEKLNLNIDNVKNLRRCDIEKYKLYSLVLNRYNRSVVEFRKELLKILKSK